MNSNLRSLFLGFISLIVLAVASLSLMTAVGVDKKQISTLFVTIMSFATLIAFQWRTAIQVAVKVEEVKQAAADGAHVIAMNVEQVKQSSAANNRELTGNVEQVRQTLATSTTAVNQQMTELARSVETSHDNEKKILTLVDGAVGIQLQIAAVALRRIADHTGHADDIKVAELAESSYRKHEKALIAAQQASHALGGEHGTPIRVEVVNVSSHPVPTQVICEPDPPQPPEDGGS